MRSSSFLAFAIVASLPAQAPLLPKNVWRRVEPIAMKIAKGGRVGLLLELRRVLRNVGASDDELRQLEARWAKAGRRAKRAARLPREASGLRAVARVWAGQLDALQPEPRERLALEILELDSSVDRAHEVFGHKRVDGFWADEDEVERRGRRIEIANALRRAARLVVPVQVAKSEHPVLKQFYGRAGVQVSAVGFVVHSVLPALKVKRMLRQAVRAAALARWFIERKLEPREVSKQMVLLDSRALYVRALASAASKEHITEENARRSAKLFDFRDGRGWITAAHDFEVFTEAHLLLNLVSNRDWQPCLSAGLLNWTAMAFLGTRLPTIAYTDLETARRGSGDGGTAATGPVRWDEERIENWQLKEAGIAGCRSWMQWLAARREDPRWSEAFVDHIGKVTGDRLLKATMVFEYLAEEEGELGYLIRATSRIDHPAAEKALEPVFEKALDMKLVHFEDDWREWILPRRNSIADRLDTQKRPLTKDEQRSLDYLNVLRVPAMANVDKRAWQLVSLDAELSAGCHAHAEYLGLNPAQASAWPDAHEEYPDRPGFSARGAWAGSNSVIAPGCDTPRQAIDGWMGTFYHRLPLLMPGLLRIGWGHHDGVAVLDAGSIVHPTSRWYKVAWPYLGMQDVPISFNPELPNPVPGQDQTAWGYPITLQVGRFGKRGTDVDVTMQLRRGTERGAIVDCWFSTPTVPTNPRIAPRRAFCLIPKQKLGRSQRYTVIARIRGGETLVWWFRT